MKNIFFVSLLVVLFQGNLHAQSYTVLYERTSTPKILGGDQLAGSALVKQIKSRKVIQLYQLLHEKGVSTSTVFKENNQDESVNSEGVRTHVKTIKISQPSILYKNIADRRYLETASFMGKKYLVKEALPQYKWEISKDSKIIGSYVCKKAVAMHGGQQVTAWYAPSIPIHDGPEKYYGLPGLIIQLIDGGVTYNALKVKETPKISIIKPTKGQVINEAQRKQLQQEQIQAIMKQLSH